MSSNLLVIFSKSPEPGKVKTRLRPVLSDEQCQSLHLAFLKDTITKARMVRAKSLLCISGSGMLPEGFKIPVRMQVGSDLGERMLNSFRQDLIEHQRVVIIGTDSPVLKPAVIDEAFDMLGSFDAVFGPAEDGGYYLIGLSKLVPELFQNVEWGGSKVLIQTLQRLDANRSFLLERCFDVDLPVDLSRLELAIQNDSSPWLQHTKEWFEDYSSTR